MFTRYFEPTEEGLLAFDLTKTPPKPPELDFPQFEGKGWAPTPTKEQLQLSAEFLQVIQDGKWEDLNRLLKFRLDLDLVNEDGFAPIHLAISKAHGQLVKFLMGQAVDIDAATDEGITPLIMACFFDEKRLVQCLLFLGANVHKITKDGLNALHYCAMYGNVEIAKKLIKRGIDITCKSKASMTPMDFAKKFHHQEFVTLLENKIKEQKEAMEKHMEKLREEQFASLPKPNWQSKQTKIDDYYVGEAGEAGNEAEHHYPRNPRKAKVRLLDEYGERMDEYSDFETPSTPSTPERTIACTNCGTEEDYDRYYCSNCKYALHGFCPQCFHDQIYCHTYCPKCKASLYESDSPPPPNDSPVEVHNGPVKTPSMIFTPLFCNACNVGQLHAYNTYCGHCRYILEDKCPHCNQTQVWGLEECSSCYKSLYNVVALQNHRAYDMPFGSEGIKRKAEDEPDEPEAPQLLQWNFVGKIKCSLCQTLVEANKEVCHVCGFIMTEKVAIENSVKVECLICFTENTVDQNILLGRFCNHCGFALGNTCPHCGVDRNTNADVCGVCNKSFWNYQ